MRLQAESRVARASTGSTRSDAEDSAALRSPWMELPGAAIRSSAACAPVDAQAGSRNTSSRAPSRPASAAPGWPGFIRCCASCSCRHSSRRLRSHVVSPSVQRVAERPEGPARLVSFSRQAEELRNAKSQLKAGVVIAAFQVPDGLVVHPDCRSEFLPGEATLGSEDGDAIVDRAHGRRELAPWG